MPATTISAKQNRRFATLLSVLLMSGLCFAQPSVFLSVKTGPPTTNVLVSGSGFTASTAVGIYFGNSQLTQAVTDNTGSFSHVGIQVPASALPGVHYVTAQESATEKVSTIFKVQTIWTEFRFANSRNGVNPYENVLSPTTAGHLAPLWSYTTGSTVWSSPAVVNGVAYIGSWDNNVYALNASTGAVLWQFATAFKVTSSPAVANGVVYVGSADNNVYALNASTGAKLWQFATSGAVIPSPAVANGVVYVGSFDHNIYALNASYGNNLWQFTTGDIVISSPAVANGVLYVGSYDDNVYAFSLPKGPKQAR